MFARNGSGLAGAVRQPNLITRFGELKFGKCEYCFVAGICGTATCFHDTFGKCCDKSSLDFEVVDG